MPHLSHMLLATSNHRFFIKTQHSEYNQHSCGKEIWIGLPSS